MSNEVKSEVAVKLTADQYQLLLYMEQYYWRRGGLPTYEALSEEQESGTGPAAPGDHALSEVEFREALENPTFKNALINRGLPRHLLYASGVLNGKVLTEQQMTVANVLMDTMDKRARVKKLMELGVSTQQYSSWLKDPVYKAYCLERAESLLQENLPVAHLALIDRVGQGDLGAIKYFNNLIGRFNDSPQSRSQQNIAVNIDNRTIEEDKAQLMQIIEIIQRHVKDPETLEAIGTDILKLRAPVEAPVISARQRALGRS